MIGQFAIQPASSTQSANADGANHALAFAAGGYPQYGGVFLVNFQGAGTAFVRISAAGGGATVADTPVSPGVPLALPIPNFGGPGALVVDVFSAGTPSGTVYVTPGILQQ